MKPSFDPSIQQQTEADSRESLQVIPLPQFRDLKAYSTPPPSLKVKLKLDANESQFQGGWKSEGTTGATLPNRYPNALALEEEIARRFHLGAERVLVTAGGDEAIDRAFRSVGSPESELVLTQPTFSMYAHYAKVAGMVIREVPWWQGPFPQEEVARQIGPKTVLVALVSPNNPTGSTLAREDLVALLSAFPKVLFLLDHAYVEFGGEDLTSVALGFPNAVVIRTFSKSWGAAGLRVGYALGHPRVIRWMRAAGQPYSVSTVSLERVLSLLRENAETPRATVDEVRKNRDRLRKILRKFELESLPSEGNFLLVRSPSRPKLARSLASLGVAVRSFKDAPLRDFVRITVPADSSEMDTLIESLETIYQPQALLFDLDGVLADVSSSYRQSIVKTARTYGVTLTAEVIAAAKARGNANNDWKLTWQLLADQGVEVDYGEVVERFESIYQGTDSQPGLRTTERLLLDPKVLETLMNRWPLAIVTGRPRADAERFLEEHGIRTYFAKVIALEDGPSKPDPTVVRLALQALGVRRAWMIGDTPDDMVAARGAGVLPVGVVPPGDDPAKTSDSLVQNGAATVLSNLNQLPEALP